jgi:hypothetical protein
MATIDRTPLLDALQNQLQIEFSTSDAIDTKALAIFAGNLTVLIFVGQSSLNLHAWYIIGLTLSLIVSLVLSVIAIWPRKYAGASVSISQHPIYLTYNSRKLVLKLISDTEQAINHNVQINQHRWIVCKWALGVAGAAAFLLFIVLYLNSK